MNFEEKFALAPAWQKARYVKFANTLGIELSDDEKRYLLWLAGWDQETEIVFTGLFSKLLNNN